MEFFDSEMVIKFQVKRNPELTNFIMEHADEIEVLEPKSLKLDIQKKLKKHKSYTKSEVIKLSGLSTKQFNELVEFNFLNTKDTYDEDDLESFKSWSYFYFLGLFPKNFVLINSVSERLEGFINYLELSLNFHKGN